MAQMTQMIRTIEERNRLVEQHIGMAYAIAQQVADRTPASVELDDLVQEACMGLMQAAERWNEGRGVGFVAYARRRVYGAVYDWMRHAHRRVNGGVGSDAYRRLRAAGKHLAPLGVTWLPIHWPSVHAEAGGVADLGARPDEAAIAAERAARLWAAISNGCLDEREKRVAGLLAEGLTMARIGVALGVTESRVSQIWKRARRRLRRALGSA